VGKRKGGEVKAGGLKGNMRWLALLITAVRIPVLKEERKGSG